MNKAVRASASGTEIKRRVCSAAKATTVYCGSRIERLQGLKISVKRSGKAPTELFPGEASFENESRK
jgi:hypothetical protein